jgi:hypothetical protein
MPNFEYTKDIPDGPHNPSADQGPMQVNTNSTNDFLAVDHFGFNDNNGGWHQQSTYPQLTSLPTTLSNQLSLFNVPGTSNNELHMVRAGDPATETTLTTSKIGVPVAASTGVSYLPGPSTSNGGGILIQWGQVASPGTSGTVFFSPPFPSGHAPFTIQLTLERNSAGQIATVNSSPAPTNTGFSYLTSSGGSTVLYWMAIGN